MSKYWRIPPRLPESTVTDESLFRQRRKILQSMSLLPVATSLFPVPSSAVCEAPDLPSVGEANSLYEISHYNNYYEFSTSKEAVALLAREMPVNPWTIEVSGEVEKPGIHGIEDLLKQHDIVERIYRFRCVEGWSMVIPWNGFQLCDLLQKAQPTSRAKYVQFVSHVDKKHMIGLNRTGLEFPYREALRIDEAMHPLTLLASGVYGQEIPPQNGAPLRLVVPWKYGFKSAKAIVKIILTEQQPETSWHQISPQEYGFFANVNPHVSHPRWSQRKENKIGELKKTRTLMFNGYEEYVAGMYTNIDLQKHF